MNSLFRFFDLQSDPTRPNAGIHLREQRVFISDSCRRSLRACSHFYERRGRSNRRKEGRLGWEVREWAEVEGGSLT